jgi:threonine dehydrogenase-like Zn-dependent dehydrogenase
VAQASRLCRAKPGRSFHLRAIRLQPNGAVLDPSAPEPLACPSDAVIRTRRAATFGPLASGPAGTIPGRDFVGVIDRLHESSDAADRRRLIGQRVVGAPDVACTRCDLCRAGLSAHCRERRTLGEAGLPGCLAERFALPVRNLVIVPDSVDDDAAAFASLLACAIHAAHAVRLEASGFVTILGDSALALLCAQVVAARTPSVRLLGMSPEKFTVCEKWGIKHRHVDEAGRRRDQAAVIDCTGTATGFAVATQTVRPRGTIVLPAQSPAPELDPRPIAESELVVIGARGGPLRDAVAMLAKGAVDVLSLVGRRARLENAAPALRASDGPALLVEF